MKLIWFISALTVISQEISCEDKQPNPGAKNKLRVDTENYSFLPPQYFSPLPEVLFSVNKTITWKYDFSVITHSKICVDEPYFEEIAKADKCKDQGKSLGVCLAPEQGHLIIQNLNAPLSYIKPFALPSKSDNVEPIVPCKNLRDDFLRCIEEVIDSKKAIESIDLYDRKIEFYEKANNRLQIEEPYFEAIVKANRCTDEMRLIGICLTEKAVPQHGLAYELLTINLTNRAPLKRKEKVEKDEDCTNLQLDLEECILKVVDENKE